jgi:hypothetical protein
MLGIRLHRLFAHHLGGSGRKAHMDSVLGGPAGICADSARARRRRRAGSATLHHQCVSLLRSTIFISCLFAVPRLFLVTQVLSTVLLSRFPTSRNGTLYSASLLPTAMSSTFKLAAYGSFSTARSQTRNPIWRNGFGVCTLLLQSGKRAART